MDTQIIWVWARKNSGTRDYIIPGDKRSKIDRARIIAIIIKIHLEIL